MAKLMNISIDVTKIDKAKLITGKKGTYLNLTVAINDEKDAYDNDVSAWQGQTKDEVQAKAQKTYLGNGRVFWSSDSTTVQSPPPTNNAYQTSEQQQDHQDLPF